MDALSAQPQDPRDIVAAELAQKLLAQLSGAQYLTRAEERTLDVTALRSLLHVVRDISTIVRYLINTTTPVNQLPTEILGHIFSFIPTLCKRPILDTATTNVRDVIPLLPALSVCRRWREVAHGASFLWGTVISIGRIALPQSYLHLYPAGPLHIAFDGKGSPPAWLLGLLRSHGTRVRELYVVLDKVSKEDLSAFQRLSLPALERCTIQVNGFGSDDPSDTPSRPAAAIFPNSSALRALRIRFAQCVPATAFPALTTLHLATVADDVYLVDLLNFLAGAPLLQDLALTDVSPHKLAATDLSGWNQGRLLFKHLKRLVVADNIDTGRSEERLTAVAEYQRGLLSILSIPTACVLAVGGVESTAHVADLLAQLWPNDSGKRCATKARIIPLGPDREWDQTGLQHFVVYLNGEGGLDVSFSIVASNGTMARARLIDGLSTGHAFKTIRKLWIAYGLKWLVTDLPGIIAALPCIEYLHISNHRIPPGSLKAFYEALAGSDGNICSPSLSTLSLDLGSIIDPSHACGSVGVGEVYEMQRSRAAAGYPLQRLIQLPESFTDRKALCVEYNADGVLVRKKPLSVIVREMRKVWAKVCRGHDHLELIRRDSDPDFD